jgi:hypothetical protein
MPYHKDLAVHLARVVGVRTLTRTRYEEVALITAKHSNVYASGFFAIMM